MPTKHYCWWCNTPCQTKDETTYSTAVYCSKSCAQLDWMFRKWMNDRYLNWLAKEVKDG